MQWTQYFSWPQCDFPFVRGDPKRTISFSPLKMRVSAVDDASHSVEIIVSEAHKEYAFTLWAAAARDASLLKRKTDWCFWTQPVFNFTLHLMTLHLLFFVMFYIKHC